MCYWKRGVFESNMIYLIIIFDRIKIIFLSVQVIFDQIVGLFYKVWTDRHIQRLNFRLHFIRIYTSSDKGTDYFLWSYPIHFSIIFSIIISNQPLDIFLSVWICIILIFIIFITVFPTYSNLFLFMRCV